MLIYEMEESIKNIIYKKAQFCISIGCLQEFSHVDM